MNIKGILFDMDNTLFDFVEAKLIACTEIISFLGSGDPEELFSYFRRGIHGFENPENIKDYMLDTGIADLDKYEKCVNVYETEKLKHIMLYPHVEETLTELNKIGLIMGILTDADSQNARIRLEKSGINRFIHSLTAFDMTGAKKPSHKPFIYALDTMALKANETLYVGDSLRRDIQPSKQLGMLSAYAAYGDRNNAEDSTGTERPDYTIDSFREILEIILEQSENERI